MKVLRASLAHVEDVRLLLNEYYEEVSVLKRDAPEEVRALLSGRASGVWIAYAEEVPAGCVVLRPLPSIPAASECKRLYVRPQYRGRGIADALLAAMENYALSMNSAWVYLDSKDDLTTALRIYRRRGYEPCERYNDNLQATIFLRKNPRQLSKE